MKREIRANRGTRINELIGEAVEQDKLFWENRVWQDDDEDSGNESFEEQEVEPDKFDSDFNDTETDESDEEDEKEMKKPNKRKGTYKEPAVTGQNRQIKKQKEAYVEVSKSQDSLQISKSLRETTKNKTIFADIARKHAFTSKPVVKAKIIPTRQFTQKSLLEEALDTEQLNAKWLQSQLLAEEEKNKMEKTSNAKSSEYRVYLSRAGTYDTMTFCGGADDWPPLFARSNAESKDRNTSVYANRKICSISGLPAKYKDKHSGLPFHSLKEYRILTSRYPR